MNRRELQTLRGQLLLLAGLFVGCIVAATVMASQRAFVEKHLQEKYVALPAELKEIADTAAAGDVDASQLERLSSEQKLALYDHWMACDDPPPTRTPRSLVTVCPALYIERAERTLVCGNREQRMRALRFLELGGSTDSIPTLRRAGRWAAKRNLPELALAVKETIRRLEDTHPPLLKHGAIQVNTPSVWFVRSRNGGSFRSR